MGRRATGEPWEVVRWSEAQMRRAARLYMAGHDPKELARRYETTTRTLRRWARRYGS